MFTRQNKTFVATVIDCLPTGMPEEIVQGWIDNRELLRKKLRGIFILPTATTDNLLKLVSTVVLSATDGKEMLVSASDVFDKIEVSGEQIWQFQVPAQSTGETRVTVHKMMRNGHFPKIFQDLGGNDRDRLWQLCLTQSQIKAFCRDRSNWLCANGSGNFFLFRTISQLFVACVRKRASGKLDLEFHDFASAQIWEGDDHHRVVVPQLPVAPSGA